MPDEKWPEEWIDPKTGERLTTMGKHRSGGYAKPLSYYEYDPDSEIECWNCGWRGTGSEGSRGSHEELFDISCPRCETMLLIVSIMVTLEEMEQAAAAGHAGAKRELARLLKLGAIKRRD